MCIVSIEYSFISVDKVPVINGSFGITRINFENTRKRVLVKRVGDTGSYFGGYQLSLFRRCGVTVYIVIVFTSREEDEKGDCSQQKFFHNVIVIF